MDFVIEDAELYDRAIKPMRKVLMRGSRNCNDCATRVSANKLCCLRCNLERYHKQGMKDLASLNPGTESELRYIQDYDPKTDTFIRRIEVHSR